MPVFKTAGIRSTGSPIPGVINPSPGAIYPTLPTPGQFANQPVVKLTGSTTAPVGQLGGQFGGGPMSISGSTGRTQSTGGGLNYTANLSIAQTLRPIAQNVFNAFQNIGGTQGVGGRRPIPTQSYQVPVPITQQVSRAANQPRNYPTPRFDTEGFVNPTSYAQPRFDTERSPYQQPTPTPQLSRVNDRIVAIGGKKYFAPTLAGMISGSTMSQTNLVEPSAKSPYNDYASGYGYNSGYPYYGYDGSGYSGSSYDYQNSAFGNVLNWRLATG